MAAPNLKEIEWAISELEAKESSDTGYALLAALYTCRDKMMESKGKEIPISGYSMAVDPSKNRNIQYGDSDFLKVVSKKEPIAAWKIMNDLMDSLQVVNPRVYDSVMLKLNRI